MRQFELNNRPIQPSYTLEQLNNTYNSLEQKHLMSVQQAAETKSAIAEMDFNEEEEWYRQKMINDIDKAIDNNTIYGNAAGALDDVIRTIGNINSNPQTIGRLKAQKDFKSFEKELNETTEIPEYMKDMYREQNKYYYSDKVDEKTGKVVGYTKWKPNKRWVQHIDQKIAIEDAIKWTSPDKGKYTKTQFLNADGQVTDKYDPNGTIYRLNSETNEWEQITAKKLQAGYDAAIAANPALRASLRQEYEVAKWGHDTGKFNDPNYLKYGTNMPKTFEEYSRTAIDKASESYTYHNFSRITNWNDTMFDAPYKGKNKGSGATYSSAIGGLHGQLGLPVQIVDRSGERNAAIVADTRARKPMLLQKTFPNLDFSNVNASDHNAVIKFLKTNNVPDSEINSAIEILDAIDYINEDAINAMSNYEKINPRYADANKFSSAIANGQRLNIADITDKRLKEDFQNLHRNFYADADYVKWSISYDDSYNDLYQKFNKYLDKGIKIERGEGNETSIYLPSSLGTDGFQIYGDIQDTYNSLSSFTKMGDRLLREGNLGSRMERIYNDGRIELMTARDARKVWNAGKTQAGAIVNQIASPLDYVPILNDVSPVEWFYGFGAFRERVESESYKLPANKNFVEQLTTFSGSSPVASAMMNMGMGQLVKGEAELIKKQEEASRDKLISDFRNIGLASQNIKVLKDEEYVAGEGKDITEIQLALKNTKNTIIPSLIKYNGKFTYLCNISDKNGNPIHSFIANNYNDPHLETLNIYSSVGGEPNVNSSIVSGMKLHIGELGDQKVYMMPNGDKSNTFRMVYGNGKTVSSTPIISKTDAIIIESIKQDLNRICRSDNNNLDDIQEQINYINNKFNNTLAPLLGFDLKNDADAKQAKKYFDNLVRIYLLGNE